MPVITPKDQIIITVDNLKTPPEANVVISRQLPAHEVIKILSSVLANIAAQQAAMLNAGYKPLSNPANNGEGGNLAT